MIDLLINRSLLPVSVWICAVFICAISCSNPVWTYDLQTKQGCNPESVVKYTSLDAG